MPVHVPCKFHLRGICSKGDSCAFYHGPAIATAEPEACRFFLKGFCAAGESCRFKHGAATSTPEQHSRSRDAARTADLASNQASESPYHTSNHAYGSYEEAVLASYGSYGASPSPAHRSHSTASAWHAGGSDWPAVAGHEEEANDGEGLAEEGYADGEGYDEEGYWEEEECTEEQYREQWEHDWTEQGHGGEAAEGYLYQDDGEYDKEEWEEWATTAECASEWADISVCPQYQQTGICHNWRTCGRPHGRQCPTCEKWILHPYNEAQRIAHTEMCSARAEREAIRAATEEQECCICLEAVMSKPPTERRFGLLSCDHAFCLVCVRGWRSHVEGGADVDSALRTCPVCRQTCHFVTPSRVWPRNQEEKEAIVGQYKQKLGSIDCKYWLARPPGDRTCPFGTSCFYRHEGAEASATPRKYLSADGEVKFGNPVMLSEFLGNMRL